MDSIGTRFLLYHQANPHVLEALEDLASRWLARNPTVGVGMLFEVLRWKTAMVGPGEPIKLSNSYRSRYARLMIERHPEWQGRITVAPLRSA